MNCENCSNEHDGTYGSGRFCNSICARGFSTKNKRQEINKKVSNKLKGKPLADDHPIKLKGGHVFTDEQRKRGGRKGGKTKGKLMKEERDRLYNLSWDDFCEVYRRWIKKYLYLERGRKCEDCKNIKWNDKRLTMELHHVDGDKNNNSRDNLQILCPNCHSQTNNWKSKNKINAPLG